MSSVRLALLLGPVRSAVGLAGIRLRPAVELLGASRHLMFGLVQEPG
jgi:hypothetical protein